jgi:pimeloyl-ACP methyl ester carboxylesterase
VALCCLPACRPVAHLEGSIELVPCQLETPGLPARIPARCGTYTVPEDRAHGGGRQIDLRIAIVPAVSRHPAPDPLVFLTGGPGQAATESFVPVQSAFRRIAENRDIVLVDQRGTGGSNPLRCPTADAADLWLMKGEALRQWAKDCLETLDADPRFYTTAIAMDDLDEVREALGYEVVNLYGVSYGTRAALSYLRQFPNRVRSVILDGVVPPTEVLGTNVARDAQRALDLLIARCENDAACAPEFPDLGGSLDELIRRLRTPAPVTLPNPRTGEPERLELDRSMAAYAIRLLSYSQETAALVPLMLRAANENDLAPLAAQFLLTTGNVGETISDGMALSVTCSEDFPFFDESVIEERNRDTYLGSLQTESLKDVCPVWPRGEIPSDFKKPIHSDVPVLLLSGEADPVTPPENGALVASELQNALHVVAPGQGHVVIHRGCIPKLATELVESGSVQGLDPSCVKDIAPAAFFTSFTGPPP